MPDSPVGCVSGGMSRPPGPAKRAAVPTNGHVARLGSTVSHRSGGAAEQRSGGQAIRSARLPRGLCPIRAATQRKRRISSTTRGCSAARHHETRLGCASIHAPNPPRASEALRSKAALAIPWRAQAPRRRLAAARSGAVIRSIQQASRKVIATRQASKAHSTRAATPSPD